MSSIGTRLPRWLGALAFLAATYPAVALAQSVTFFRVTRENSPRAGETLGTGGIVPTTEAVGTRDCACEVWRFEGNYMPPAGARLIEWWVGTTATACATAANRQPGLATTTCWQIPSSVVAPAPVGANANSFNIRVPARWLVDPINGNCRPPGTLATTQVGRVYFTALIRPPEDMSPAATQEIQYSLEAPITPHNVSAGALENGARVTWSIGTATSEDGGLSTIPEQIRGYYVLCLPDNSGLDAGATDAATCSLDGVSFGDASSDAGDGGVEAGAEAGADAGDDAGLDASGGMGGGGDAGADDGGGGSCSVAGLPAGFNPNDEAQFQRYRCSSFIPRTSNSFEVTGLRNGAAYRFAVVSQDNGGNRSVPSALTPCITPQLVTDFWEHYERHGGAARGGLCAARPGAFGGGAAALGSIVALGVALGVRRARRGRARGAR